MGRWVPVHMKRQHAKAAYQACWGISAGTMMDTIVAKGSLILSFLGARACFGELAGLVLGTLLHIAS